MIKSVTVVNHLGESLKLDLASPEKSGFIVKSIEGLGPVKATVNATKMSTTDGALYFDERVQKFLKKFSGNKSMEHPIREILEFVSCIKLVPWPMFIIGTNGTSKMATTKNSKCIFLNRTLCKL